MIKPAYNNDMRRGIAAVARGILPPSALRDTVALHQAAMMWDWDSMEPEALLDLARHPDLARGTLLMLFWRSAPGYYLQYAGDADVPASEREGYETGQRLAAIYAERTDLKDGIAFDPRDDDGYDCTTAYADGGLPQLRAMPAHLLRAVPGEACAWAGNIDGLTRAPDGAEQARIAAAVARGRALLPGLAADAGPRDVVAAVAAAMRAPVSDDLAWLWLDQVGWPWRCGDSETDGVLFGVVRDGLTMFVPDIVRRTVAAGIDPGETIAFFDLLSRQREGALDDAFWDESERAFARGWLVPP